MKLRLIEISDERRDGLQAVVAESHPWLSLSDDHEISSDLWQLDRRGTLHDSVREEYILAESLESRGFRLHITEDNQWEVR